MQVTPCSTAKHQLWGTYKHTCTSHVDTCIQACQKIVYIAARMRADFTS